MPLHSQSTGHNTSESESFAASTTDTQGKTHTLGDTQTLGSSTQQSLEIENHRITALLEVIEQHLERLAAGKAFGSWNLAAYFVAGTTETSTSLSSLFLGLTRGETSKVSPYALNTWNASNANSAEARDQVLNWLRNLCHPRFQPLSSFNRLDLPYLTPAIFANGQEMVLQMGLPRSSAGSVSVVDAPRYGRTVKRLNQKQARAQQQTEQIHLGKIRHLWRDSPESVDLDLDRLCYHALITGTTGVGKTTTVKSLLTQLHQQGIPFMVLEPAKGEYKELAQLNTASQPVNHLLVGRAEGNALKLNPFVFPQGMALTDHVDRVVTIFNAAFSMSGPMPQLLEEAVFTAYEELGWDTHSSRFIGSQLRYPTLLDVLDQIPRVVKALGYSDQVVGDFVGALTARLKSLTRGSLGASLVCSAEEETSDAQLFTESNIIDLSAMGSPDKRAIVMGLLFMRLCEFRLLNGLPEDARLRHFMVLEEAHVLLKKTSTDQIQESSNSVGLAVEAFASALAEMRAYGQGFMVADQSASAIDDSVIKNTNLKIVMRAPYEADRITLGGALALDEQQTLFLSKLENHTAVIYQSDWLEPVLCKIDKQDITTKEQNEPADQKADSCNKLKVQLIYTLWSKRLKPCDMVQQKDNPSEIKLLFDQLEIPEDQQSTLEEFIYSEREFPKQYEVLKDVLLFSIFKPIIGTQQMSLRSLSNRLNAQLIELGIHLPIEQRSIVVKDLLRILRPSEKKQISDLSIIY